MYANTSAIKSGAAWEIWAIWTIWAILVVCLNAMIMPSVVHAKKLLQADHNGNGLKKLGEGTNKESIGRIQELLAGKDKGQYHPELCDILPDDLCLKVSHFLTDAHERKADIRDSDKALIEHLSKLQSDVVERHRKSEESYDNAEMIRMSAFTLGSQAGYAAETRRNNQFFFKRSQLLDKIAIFSDLMLTNNGRLIVPPIIDEFRNDTAISEKGRVFRVASRVYRIKEKARFSLTPPKWQSYLQVKAPKPRIPDGELLPKTDYERAMWMNFVKKGYLTGVIQARKVGEYNIRKLANDVMGMVRYHVLLTYGMVSKPIVDARYYTTTGGGSHMQVNDNILSIDVYPELQNQVEAWKAIPRINNFKFLNISEDDDFNDTGRLNPEGFGYE